ncbi:ASCH domain-containing protein [Citricoccus nitrophenolicus]|uniref:ASCH domain-containing protein n=1 Tax=Citricoccus nitrophenolicus TaxID=863575 RepID=A0ABV0IJ60_9MICC|nr:ASCH domain-containing protein [Citricoccus sp. I39-566]WMY78571.1 ASCH domain-containing protein [Citricoccus sp. I39-566]
MTTTPDHPQTAFWLRARTAAPALPSEPPEAWAFGATEDHADALLELVLAGTKTATASSAWDLEATGEPLPQAGTFSVILDGAARPRAVIETTDVRVLPFDGVDADHAWSEGEGDRSLSAWREIHERYWRSHAVDPRGWRPDMPVVCERFRLIYREVSASHCVPAPPQ